MLAIFVSGTSYELSDTRLINKEIAAVALSQIAVFALA